MKLDFNMSNPARDEHAVGKFAVAPRSIGRYFTGNILKPTDLQLQDDLDHPKFFQVSDDSISELIIFVGQLNTWGILQNTLSLETTKNY